DPLTALMLVVVTTIALLVQIFSWGYMTETVLDEHGHPALDQHGHPIIRHDPGLGRYYAYHSLFAAAMLGLVLANNLLTLYIFWEGVGLGSYLLIGFWYDREPDLADLRPNVNPVDERPSPASAAKKAFITTRLGDFGMLVGILVFWVYAGTLDFTALSEKAHAHQIDPNALTIAAILLFCGAVGKS